MPFSTLKRIVVAATMAAAGLGPSMATAGNEPLMFEQSPGRVQIYLGGAPFATYVYDDPEITRPYLANVRAPGGVQVTRNHPPVEGVDLMDHPTFHPGIWLAFGDLNGADDWRLTAPVRHVDFIEPPSFDRRGFTVLNSYRTANDADEEICREQLRCRFYIVPAGYLIDWQSTFSSDREFAFGDQEEMGLGLRMATALRAQRQEQDGVPPGNGTILDAEGRRNEAEVWGHAADWCDYSGVADGQRVGMTIFCHPDNFRPSWFHARDRGLLTANPFGQAAFRQGDPSRIVVAPGEEFALKYGILVHTGPDDVAPDLDAAYRHYLELAGGEADND